MPTVAAVNPNINAQKGKKTGTVIGAGIGTGYVLKNGKDVFQTAVQDGLAQFKDTAIINGKNVTEALIKKNALLIAGGVCAGAVVLCTVAGRLIGAGIGKLMDKHNQQKQQKELIAKAIEENVKNVEPISVEELEQLVAEEKVSE